MNTEFNEIEVKLAADNLTPAFFMEVMSDAFGPLSELFMVRGRDVYHTQGDNVVRHRHQDSKNENGGTLTVKRRTSSNSITNRAEVDLPVKATREAIELFLNLTGFKSQLTLDKTSWIASFNHGNHEIVVALYTVHKVVNNKVVQDSLHTFLEIEVEKSKNIELVEAKRVLKDVTNQLLLSFNESEQTVTPTPIQLSLYELYEGKLYKMVAA